MAAPTENEFWKLRTDLSEDGKKLSVKEVIKKCQEYINYCRNNPLKEVDYRGKDAGKVYYPRMRAMTIEGLCHHLGIVRKTWDNWKKDKKYLHICSRVEQLIFVQKFEGAAAGMLNHNIIARNLGLVDKKEIEIETNLTKEERAQRIEALKSKLNE